MHCFLLLLAVAVAVAVVATTFTVAATEHDTVRRECEKSRQGRASPSLMLFHHPNAGRLTSLQQAQSEAVRVARQAIALVRSSAAMMSIQGSVHRSTVTRKELAWRDCAKLYDDSEYRLKSLAWKERLNRVEDARTWLSGALASHGSCMDGLRESNAALPRAAENLTVALSNALALFCPSMDSASNTSTWWEAEVDVEGLLTSAKPHLTVTKDGSGNYKTINEAVAEVARWTQKRPPRVVIYVKSGVYAENVEIDLELKDITFIGDGIDKTVVTGNRNVIDGSTTLKSATFGISGDGFWARDMTFENTAGPEKHQAVALSAASDLSVFYRCSFPGYQDTLQVHSLRQFYRDCHIYGIVDFIIGDAATGLQNCDIFVRKPMDHQANMITAQGRDDPNQNTGISIHGCRVAPAPGFQAVKGSFKTYLGRPWKTYSRMVVMKTDLDGLIEPEGWSPWGGDFALSTLYYGEYLNTGVGAATEKRVHWPGFHVLKDAIEAERFTVSKFIDGESWIPGTGPPVFAGL